jgi:S1-C subfamily serine protease
MNLSLVSQKFAKGTINLHTVLLLLAVGCSVGALGLSIATYTATTASPLQASPVVPTLNSLSRQLLAGGATTKAINTPQSTHPGFPSGQAFSTLVADVAEVIAPSVVNIDVASQVKGGMRFPFGSEGQPSLPELFNYFFTPSPQGDQHSKPPSSDAPQLSPDQGSPFPERIGNGSGLVYDKQGHILTNYHVVAKADSIKVTFSTGQTVAAKVVGKDPLTDLAVLKLDSTQGLNLQPAPLGNSSQLRPGEWVLAVGSPLGFDHTVTLGIISALSRQVPDINANLDFIQTDAAINPGNSGGPLVNLQGQVIGINTAIAGHGQNIGFAIPAQTLREVVPSLVAKGKVDRPMIGLSMVDVSPDLLASLGLNPTTQGVVISRVVEGSPADKAGFEQGDVIQRIEGQKVSDAKDVQRLVRNVAIGSTLHIQIVRQNELKALSVTTVPLDDDLFER